MVPSDEEKEAIGCDHEDTRSENFVWIKPSPSEKVHSPAQKRQFCPKCGKIKYQGSATAKKMGFYVNILKEIQRKMDVLYKRKMANSKLTQVQVRLILKELEEDEEFNDRFSNNQHNQWGHFKFAIKRHCDIPEELVESIYRDFKG